MLGPPGAGKGTQAKIVAEKFSLAHISTGDIFRYNIKNDTELGKQVKAIVNSGGLVPDELTVALVKDRLQKEDCVNGAVLDGFPRTTAQADALAELLADLGSSIAIVPYVKVRDEEVVERLSGRRTDKRTGKIYHLKYNPPPHDADLEHRKDDQEETILERLEEYHTKTAPLIAYYQEKGLLAEINGEEQIDLVSANLLRAVEAAAS